VRIPKIVILLPLLAYGAAMGYLWYKTKSSADEVAQTAAPFAEIQYGSVHVSPFGDEVGLNDVRIRPTMNADEFRIDTLRFNVPHIGYFITGGSRLEQGELPEKLGMQLGRMEVDLGSETFTMLEQMQQQFAAMQPAGAGALDNLGAVGCGSGEAFTISDYRRMGMGALVMDAAVNLEYDKRLRTARVRVDVDVEGLQQLDVVTEFDTGPELQSAVAAGVIPRVTLNYRDSGYYRLRNAFCASQNGSTEEEYVERHLQMLAETLGATFPEESVAAYRRFMLKGGTLNATMSPVEPVDPNGLGYYPVESIVQMLGLELVIDERAVDMSQVQWDRAATDKPAEPASTAQSRPQATRSAPPPRPVPKRSATTASGHTPAAYREIRVQDAGSYLKQQVEISTNDGKVRRGRLDKIGNGRLYLIIRLSAGELSYGVEQDKITRLRVVN